MFKEPSVASIAASQLGQFGSEEVECNMAFPARCAVWQCLAWLKYCFVGGFF
jgi:hypothetical protein